MCGIHAVIWPSNRADPGTNDVLHAQLRARGPDHVGTVQMLIDGASSDDSLNARLTSTVLSLRGNHVAQQPLVDLESGSALCWNGEVWRLDGRTLQGNDTEAVFRLLLDASTRRRPADQTEEEKTDPVLETLRTIEGPFAFIYVDKPAKRLYTGRDRLGRRSLLRRDGIPFILSSIAEPLSDDWIEVEADGCYVVQLDQLRDGAGLTMSRRGWHENDKLISGIGMINTQLMETPPSLTATSIAVRELHDHLAESLSLRVLGIPGPPGTDESDSRLAVLFSGGLDCTMLARISHDILPAGQAVDLINVAFENPRIASQNKTCTRDQLYELCPDRITGRKSFNELAKTCPGRMWRMVTVNVPFEETCMHRDQVVALMHPHHTEMDLSIANALYFAARGKGFAITAEHTEPAQYETTARVLLSGLGADELFGGYSRHGAAFTRGGYPELIEELKLDVGRLGKRNLGRDDRVMSHWGREVRFPFLDERLVKWAIDLPAWDKCDFHTPASPDTGLDAEKRVLRILAGTLGMSSVSKEKKRAIQFGARTAKMQSGRVKGTAEITR